MVQNNVLVNNTKETYITLGGLSKRGEIIGNTLQCKMVAAFLFDNNGDEVFFVASDWHFGNEPLSIDQDHVFRYFKDVTLELLRDMVEEENIDCPLHSHLRCPMCLPHPEKCSVDLFFWFGVIKEGNLVFWFSSPPLPL